MLLIISGMHTEVDCTGWPLIKKVTLLTAGTASLYKQLNVTTSPSTPVAFPWTLILVGTKKIKSSLYLLYHAKTCNELADPSLCRCASGHTASFEETLDVSKLCLIDPSMSGTPDLEFQSSAHYPLGQLVNTRNRNPKHMPFVRFS